MRRLRVLASPAHGGAAGNPYIDQLTAALRANGADVVEFRRSLLLRRPDVVHVHWPMTLVRWDEPRQAAADCAKVLSLLWIARRRGAVLVWTGHDTMPHEGLPTWLHRAFFSAFLSMVDGVVSLGDAASGVLRERWPQLRRTTFTVVPHGHYRDAYPTPPSRAAARQALGLDGNDRIFLALGQIRPYKDLASLASAFSAHAVHGELLAVAGSISSADLEKQLRRASDPASVRLVLGRVSEADVAAWHSAADVCILFYSAETALNSGAALLGLSLATPVVVRDSPAMRELGALVGDEWVVRVDGDASAAVAAAQRISTRKSTTKTGPRLDSLEWDRLGRLTMDAYRRFLNDKRRS